MCLSDSMQLLRLEQMINTAMENKDTRNVFHYLCKIVAAPQIAEPVRSLASIVLKNTLRNHVISLKQVN